VKIVGHLNMPGRIAASASLLYAKNLFAFLETLTDKASKQLAIDVDGELVKPTLLTHGGNVVHPAFNKAGAAPLVNATPTPAASKPAKAKSAEPPLKPMADPAVLAADGAVAQAPAKSGATAGTKSASKTRKTGGQA
jgi:NAD(P) transhydrogenase subunit alpha